MDRKAFLNSTILNLEDNNFDMLKEALVGEYITFDFLTENDLSKNVFAEKIYDYFDKIELKTCREFDKILETYMINWETMVSRRIANTPKVKKGESPLPAPRAKKYFDYACSIKDSRQLTIKQILDYSRIMMCLYISVINNEYREITDFDYSSKCLNLEKIIASMKLETVSGAINIGKKTKPMYEINELFSLDTCTFIMTIFIYYYIKDVEV